MQPKVSIVVPCYNKEAYIDALLQSICDQIWDNIEVILVNDGSTDGTREIIRQWEPKLMARGYEVNVVDQENAGVCRAARAGLLCATGEYFCTVDADDRLHPEYVSSTAGFLADHKEYAFTSCNFCTVTKQNGRVVVNQPSMPIRKAEGPRMLERYLLCMFQPTVWVYMVRMEYLKQCRVNEEWDTPSRGSHEPGYIIPLAGHGGRCCYIDKPLYYYNVYASGDCSFPTFEKVIRFHHDYLDLSRHAIQNLNMDPATITQMLNIADWTYWRALLYYTQDVPGGMERLPQLAVEACHLLDQLFLPAPNIAASRITLESLPLFLHAVALNILEEALPIKIREGSSVIGYGAMGKMADRYLPMMKGTPLWPTLLWDQNADGTQQAYGLPIAPPNYSALQDGDILAVFPANTAVCEEVITRTKSIAGVQILNRHQLYDQLSLLRFPEVCSMTMKNERIST